MLTKCLLTPTLTTYQTECIYKRARQWRSQHKKLLKKVRKYIELVATVHDNVFFSLFFLTVFRVMVDVDGRLSKFSIPLIKGSTSAQGRYLSFNCYGFSMSLAAPVGGRGSFTLKTTCLSGT
jgi:hypothetical protein